MGIIVAEREKAVGATKTYAFDWGPYLDGDTLSSATWVVPAPLVKDSETNDGRYAYVKVSGGVLGNSYELECTGTLTNSGDIIPRVLVVHMR